MGGGALLLPGGPARGDATLKLLAAGLVAALLMSFGLAAADESPSPIATEPAEPAAAFEGSVERIPADLRQALIADNLWRRGCPVPIRRLRLLSLDYFDFDGVIHDGFLVVHRKEANEVLRVFEVLYEHAFPLEHVAAATGYPPAGEEFKGNDVTAAFNCRNAVGTNHWSQHAYGLAVDVDPLQNPYVNRHTVIPRAGRDYIDRSLDLPGMIHKNDYVVQAFSRIGWEWGGNWHSLKDYMHFSENGH